VPTGAFVAVAEQPWLDFRVGKPVGRDIEQGTVAAGGGYDNAFVFSGWTEGGGVVSQAVVSSPLTGISMELVTDQPSVQFYSGNNLDCSIHVKADQASPLNPAACYPHWGAVVLEAQRFPDSVHHFGDPSWPSVALEPGQVYSQRTGYRFTLP